MATVCPSSLIGELEFALNGGTVERRNEILRRVTDLFLSAADACEDEQVGVFDDVLQRLVGKVERYALIRLSMQLAPVGNAPSNVVHRLADSDDIAVAGPVIEKSTLLSDDFLVGIAKTKSQAHLSAIAARSFVSEPVVDVVVDRGDIHVTRKIVGNAGARFSKTSMNAVSERARGDEALAVGLSKRQDIPDDVLCDLAQRATEIVRQRLISARPEMRERIDQALAAASSKVAKADRLTGGRSGAAGAVDLSPEKLRQALSEKARNGDRVGAVEVLAKLTEIPAKAVDNLIRQGAEDGVLILCKAAGLGWPDAKAVLGVTASGGRDPQRQKEAFDKYITLTADAAQRVMRFVKLRRSASKSELKAMM